MEEFNICVLEFLNFLAEFLSFLEFGKAA